jgi:hypothetical protein
MYSSQELKPGDKTIMPLLLSQTSFGLYCQGAALKLEWNPLPFLMFRDAVVVMKMVRRRIVWNWKITRRCD